MRKLLRPVLNIIFRVFTRLSVTGLENLPLSNSCLLTSNHLGIIDGPLVFSLIQRDDATGLAAQKHKSNPIIRFIVDAAGGIWIDRNRTDFRALKEARKYLNQGGLLGIAPEGTRSDSHTMIKAKQGVAFLADKSNAVVIPIGITGTENSLKKILTLQRPKISVTIGKPYQLPPIDRRDRERSLAENTDEIMCRIAALLPETYRGYYANHPRLKQLLVTSST